MSARLVAALLAGCLGCHHDPTVASLAEENRAAVEAFRAKLLAIEPKLATAPVAPTGFSQPLKVDEDTVTLRAADFHDLLAQPPAAYDPSADRRLDPETSWRLTSLMVDTYHPPAEGTTVEVYRKLLAWYPKQRFVAVFLPAKVVEYDAMHLDVRGAWSGRIAVYDLAQDQWVGAVALAIEGEPLVLEHYVNVDTRTHEERGSAFQLADRDLESARYALHGVIDRGAEAALASGKSITSAAEVPAR